MRVLLACSVAALALACASTPVVVDSPEIRAEKQREDLLVRLSERMADPSGVNAATLMNNLEHMLPLWHDEHRRGRAEVIEKELTITVVPQYDVVAEMFETGPHERKLVAAWALGFSRVPDNDWGIPSHHLEAMELLVRNLQTSPDDVMRNQLLGLWLLAEPTTPVDPLIDILVNHHDADVRANTMLALTTILSGAQIREHRNAVLVALADEDPRVRLHATSIARHHPDESFTVSMEARLGVETMPLVRANLAAALGAAKARSAAPMLVKMLGSPRKVEAQNAHDALVQIFDRDYGLLPEEWQGVLDDEAERR